LGKILFWDEQLSSDDSAACGTCHVPEVGGGDPRFALGLHPGPDGLFATADDIVGSPGTTRQAANGDFTPDAVFGLRRQATARVANSNHGAAYHTDLFWDGRASSTFVDPETNQTLIPFGGALESQALGPILSAVEMGTEGRTWQDVRTKLQAARPLALALSMTPDIQAALAVDPTYPDLFEAAFGDPAITAARIAFALATYQRTLQPDDTPWDRYMQGQTAAMTPMQVQGWNLFNGVGRCNACHPAPLFHDDQFHNLGLRWAAEDRGLGAITNIPPEDGAFKTPGLRNAGLRPRLFHNGQSPGLLDPTQASNPASTLNVYKQGGGVDRSNLDPFLLPLNQLGVTTMELQTIQHFVATALTDPRAATGLPPFDHPRLRSLEFLPPRNFGLSAAGGEAPFLIDTVPSNLGNGAWKLGVAAPAGTPFAYIGYGTQSIEPAMITGGLPWNIQVNDGRILFLDNTGGGPARATWRLPIPSDPSLTNVALYFQAWMFDAGGPQGVATSRGVEFLVR
ncbi:MAG: hypothetical protein RL398_1513, partial [Planctomycetota bacterium]